MSLSKKPNRIVDAVRRSKGVTIARMAFDLGIDYAATGRLCQGLWTPQNPARRRQIAEYLGVAQKILFPGMPADEATVPSEAQGAESC